MPTPGAAKPSVPKNCPGMMFCTWGEPGRAVMVKVKMPRAMVPGISRLGMSATRKSSRASGNITKATTNRLMPP